MIYNTTAARLADYLLQSPDAVVVIYPETVIEIQQTDDATTGVQPAYESLADAVDEYEGRLTVEAVDRRSRVLREFAAGLTEDERPSGAYAERLSELVETYDTYGTLDTSGLDANMRYLLVERSTRDREYFLTTHNDRQGAAEYHDNQESAEDWTIEVLIDLAFGTQWSGESRTSFRPIEGGSS
jgi:hypothetical protein